MKQRIREWFSAIHDFFTPIPNPATGEMGPSAFMNMMGRWGGRIADGWRSLTGGGRDPAQPEENEQKKGTGIPPDQKAPRQAQEEIYREPDTPATYARKMAEQRQTAEKADAPRRRARPLPQAEREAQMRRRPPAEGEGEPVRQPAGRPYRSTEGHEPERRPRRRTLEEPQVSPLFVFRSKPKPRNFVLSVIVTTLKLFAVLILVGGISGLGFGLGIAQAYVATTPDLDITQIEDQSETSFIYDMDGNLITMYTGVENRIWATREEMPQMLLDAIVSIEDERFYSHSGVDIKRIIGALFSNMRSSTTQGGSTITQQLIKMRVLSSEQTYKRKLQEAYLAIQLEKEYSKDEILVAYLNTINLAQSNYGVKAAAEDYFGKELSELSLRECAMLAGCAQAPYTYDPRSNFYTRDRAEVTNKRTDLVLAAMYKNNKITKEQYEQALNDTLVILEKSPRTQKYDYPYFVEYAVQDVITHLLRDRGLPDNDTNRSQIESEIRTSGYHIYTTMDASMQDTLQNTLYNWENYPNMKNAADATSTTTNADGSRLTLSQPQVAANIVDYHNGYVKAVVGGRQEPTTKKGLSRATSSQPPGSSIKPISVYGPAIDQGIGAGTIIADMPAEIKGWGGRGYPNNSGNTFHGPVSLRQGIVNSYNVVAARVLADYVGYDVSAAYLRELGVSSALNVDGPGLALGTSGLTVMELAGAYTALANGGVYVEPVTFTKIVDSKGDTVLESSKTQIRRQVFKESTAWLMTDILEDAVDHGTGTRAKISGMTTAGKTGTNSDNCGVSFVGYTPYYVSAIWVGHDNYKPMRSTSGGKGAAPVFKEYMTAVHEGLEDKPIYTKSAEEVGLKRVTVCGVSGMLATAACSADAAGHGTVTDYFTDESAPTRRCTMHQQLTYCSESGKLASPYCPQELCSTQSAFIVPADSPYRNMDRDKLLAYFPNAILDYPENGALSYDNEKHKQYYCDIHTQQWAEQQAVLTPLIQQSQALINEVQSLMEQVALDSGARNQLTAAISALAEACNVTQEATAIQNAYDNLNGLKLQYLQGGGDTPTEPVDPTETTDPTNPPETTGGQ